jgi:glutamate N-acetyltransferase/amino-acid N-acetyltransferase
MNNNFEIIEGKGLSFVKGFSGIGIHSGIKKARKRDLCLIYTEKLAVAAASFTKNIVKAAPVIVDMENIQSNHIRALIINSGNANACTGEDGLRDAREICHLVSASLGITEKQVLIYSTGVIGEKLPMDKLRAGIIKCQKKLIKMGKDYCEEAIMTTDTRKKDIFLEIQISGKKVSIYGMAKGSGMIHPNMATMLSYIISDCAITKEMLTKIHQESVENSYNLISVDGDTSTNDTATIIANGCAENEIIRNENEDYMKFKEAVDYVNLYLAKEIARDGEGAEKLIEVNLIGAATMEIARKCARSIVSSSLVKTAIHGSDANWGRILCAIGYAGGDFNPEKVDLSFKSKKGQVTVFKAGSPVEFDEKLAKSILCENEIVIIANLNDGEHSAIAFGCDLTNKYIKINGSYRS